MSQLKEHAACKPNWLQNYANPLYLTARNNPLNILLFPHCLTQPRFSPQTTLIPTSCSIQQTPISIFLLFSFLFSSAKTQVTWLSLKSRKGEERESREARVFCNRQRVGKDGEHFGIGIILTLSHLCRLLKIKHFKPWGLKLRRWNARHLPATSSIYWYTNGSCWIFRITQ